VGNEIREEPDSIPGQFTTKLLLDMPQGLGRYSDESSQGLYYLKNHLGTTMATALMGASGTEDVYDYFPYGVQEKRVASGEDKVTPTFTGKELDEGLGLYYFGARYFDPEFGLWISPDPARQYHSPYDYTGGNPVNLVDPDGRAAGPFARLVYRAGSKLVPGRHLSTINDAEKALSKNMDVMFNTAQDRDRVLKNLGQGEKGMMHRQGHKLPDGSQGASHGHVAGHPEGFGHAFISKVMAAFGAVGTLLTLTDPLVYAAEVGSPEFADNFSWSRHYEAVDRNPFVVDLLSDVD
jgi:RHS repeat-associated protein